MRFRGASRRLKRYKGVSQMLVSIKAGFWKFLGVYGGVSGDSIGPLKSFGRISEGLQGVPDGFSRG